MTEEQRVFAARFTTAFAALLALLSALCAEPAWAAQQRVKIVVTTQLLREVASFVCGDHAVARALSVMDANGDERLISRPARGEIIIAFDAADAARHRISAENKNLRLLFDKADVTEAEMRGAFFDPAMLPFVAQEIMKTVAQIDPEGYAYYQRRLAEFQSRIDSAIGVGRHMLADSGAKMLDLTGAEGVWIRSSIPGVVRPPDEVWNGWLAGDETALRAALDEAARRGWLLLFDPWTPETIRAAAVAYHNRLTLAAPSGEGDIFVFFHDMLAAILARVGEKSSDKK